MNAGRAAKSARAEAAFRSRVSELGGMLMESTWLGATTRHRVRCAVGHENMILPATVKQRGGICKTCAGKDSDAAWELFKARVRQLGGVVLEPTWLGNSKPHRVRCAVGHDCTPWPASIQQGRGLCRTCAGRDPKAAEKKFRDRVAELGGVVLEPEWLGSAAPHRVQCAAGHVNSPRPGGCDPGPRDLPDVCGHRPEGS